MKKLNMRTNDTDGFLITFCGLDGCGKTTMINRVVEYLNKLNYETVLTKQPTDAVRNSNIFRTFMDSSETQCFDYRSLSLLAASDRVQHTNCYIYPELQKGKIVISDRYYYSCLANLRARGYYSDQWIYEIAESIVKPDVSIFIDVPVKKAIERVRSRPKEKNRYIDIDLQYELHEQYLKISKENNGITVSSSISEDETFKQIIYQINEKLGEKIKWKAKTLALQSLTLSRN